MSEQRSLNCPAARQYRGANGGQGRPTLAALVAKEWGTPERCDYFLSILD
jgi:hypothetical protein